MRMKFYVGVAAAALLVPSTAFAQSTGSIDFEEPTATGEDIVVTGTRAQQVGGVTTPPSPRARQVLTEEAIGRQNAGQSILDTINLVPGVSYQNNDAYGSSGGTLTVRGFTSDRVSLTADGIPLNDSGNYAIFGNQQFDPEILSEVNVNLGTTDVDSPTASAAGGTVNLRTINPREELGARMSASWGEFNFFRVFGLLETGNLTSFGTRAFVSASKATNDNPFNNYSRVDKQQYNAKLYQPIGSNGDFISIAGHYNQNRNNFFGSLPLRQDPGRVVGPGAGNRFPTNRDEREYDINFPCNIAPARAGVADSTNTCGTEFERRFNPSNTGNIRGASRFTFGDFTFTVDPSYQYVKANGGGTAIGREGFRRINGVDYTGFIGGQYYFGRDLNGDGDVLDTCSPVGAACSSANTNGVSLLAPNQTQTHRYAVIAGVRWDISTAHTVRAGYTFDRARHRQTGQLGLLQLNGEPFDVFPVNDPLTDATGTVVQRRDRLSFATLNQVWGEYRGEFLEGRLILNAGVRAPFFKRELNNFCFTTSAGGFVDCFGRDNPRNAQYAAANPNFQGPQQRIFEYDRVLPSGGFTYEFMDRVSAFGSYSKGLSVPGTDNLYNSFFFAPDTAAARPRPETTDNFDLGLRYRSGQVQAQVSGFYNKYKDRQASAFDPDLNVTVFRNLGEVEKYGIDGYISYQPIPQLQLYAFGSYLKSRIEDDLIVGECNVLQVAGGFPGCTTVNQPIFAPTAGKREAGSPDYTYGGTVRGTLGEFDLGITGKRTGRRFVYDTNEPVRTIVNGVTSEVFPAAAPAYWLVNLDARVSLQRFGLERTHFQLNVYNLFDEFYVGGFGGGLNQQLLTCTAAAGCPGGIPLGGLSGFGNPPFVQIGAPRTISGTITVAF